MKLIIVSTTGNTSRDYDTLLEKTLESIEDIAEVTEIVSNISIAQVMAAELGTVYVSFPNDGDYVRLLNYVGDTDAKVIIFHGDRPLDTISSFMDLCYSRGMQVVLYGQ